MKAILLISGLPLLLLGCASGPLSDLGYTNANNNIAGHGIGIQASTGSGPADQARLDPGGGVVTGGVIQMPGQGGEGQPQSTNSMPPGAWYMF